MEIKLSRSLDSLLFFFFRIFKKWLPYDVYAYLAVGGLNTALNILLFAVFYEWILPKQGIWISDYNIASYIIALLMAFFATIPTGFWLNKNFAFIQPGKSTKKTLKQLLKYLLVVGQGLGSDFLILKCLVLLMDMEPTIGKIISTVIVLTVNFLLQKYFTFKN